LRAKPLAARCNILPEPRFAPLKSILLERLGQIGAAIQPENFCSLLDALMREVLQQAFADAGADEGSVWLLDDAAEHLIIAHNTGPNASRVVGQFKQPVHSGLIGMVFASEQPFIENEVYKNSRQNKTLDELLSCRTSALLAAPFYFLDACRGIVSAVQLEQPDSPETRDGFDPDHLAAVQRASALLGRLIEFRLLSDTVGWSRE